MAKKEFIRTVAGDIAPQALGFCDCHSHPMVDSDFLAAKNAMFDVRDYDKSRDELRSYRLAGGRALVDAQPLGCGRATECLPRLSAACNVHIVAATGFHVPGFYPQGHWCLTLDAQALSRIFIEELTAGMYAGAEEGPPARQISARAGIIKCASESSRLNALEKRRLEAAAQASLATGAPLLCHTDRGSALEHAGFLIACGVQPQSIIMAHVDRSPLPAEEYLLRLAEAGVYLELDAIATDLRSEESEIALIQQIFRRGYGAQLMLGFDPVRCKLKSYGGTPGFDYIPQVFVPRLLASGLSRDEARQLTVDTPARALAFQD